MRNKKYKVSQCLSATQILSKVKRQMSRQKQYQKIEQNLLYLNNSFNNNIQLQEIFIDICKGKKKNIRSKQLKTMYNLFSENKANLLIFEKIVDLQMQRIKNQKQMSQSTFSKWAKDTKGLMQIIQQEQAQTQMHINTNSNLQNQNESSTKSIKNQQKQSQSLDDKVKSRSKNKQQQLSINARNESNEIMEDERQFYFLIRRIYCRLIQKILVKIAFYTMNNKFLDFIALNILDLTKNLQTMIRRLKNIKDLRLLQQIVIKVYRQNLLIQNKIYQMLVNGGYIVSIDQFYRVNGIDVAHKDIYQRSSINQDYNLDSKRKNKLTLKQKIMKMKQKKQKQNIVKKDYIDRTNNQINQKYLLCVSRIKNIINQEEQQQDKSPTQIKSRRKSSEKQKNQDSIIKKSNFSKTQPLLRRPSNFTTPPKLSRFSTRAGLDSIEEGQNQHNIRNSQDSDASSRHSRDSIDVTKTRSSKRKTIVQYSSRISTFSPQFSKLIKTASQHTKNQRNSAVLSEKFLQFNEFQRGKRKQSKTHSQSDQNQSQKGKKTTKLSKKKSSEMISTFAINKILKLYEARNTDRYSVDSFLGSNINLPPQFRQSLKQELLKLQGIYDSGSKSSSKKQPGALQVYPFQQKLTHQRAQSQTSNLNKHNDQRDEQSMTSRTQLSNSSSDYRKVHFSNPNTLLKKKLSDKQDQNDINMKPFSSNVDDEKIIVQTFQDNASKQSQQNKESSNLNINQFSLVKLSKNRVKRLNSAQKITSINNSVFTNFGVKNLRNQIIDGQVPLKNQKLKRIPFFKLKDKFSQQISNFTTIKSNIKTNKKQQSIDNQVGQQYPKLLRKAYQNQQSSTSKQFLQKSIQQIYKDSSNLSQNPINKKMIHRKGNSLHKMFTYHENNIIQEKDERMNKFNTFYPKFINKTVHISGQNKQNYFERTKKLRTTFHQSNSEPISPRNSFNKQYNPTNLFEIYDIRKRRKLFK